MPGRGLLSASGGGRRKAHLTLAAALASVYSDRVIGGDDAMKWLTAILVLLLFGLAAFPAAIDTVGAWVTHRSEHVQAIDYLPREIDEMSASRRRPLDRQERDRNPTGTPDENPF